MLIALHFDQAVLLRLTLEHLGEVVGSTFEGLNIRQEVLDSNLVPILSVLESQLQLNEKLWLAEERKEKKKRKASCSPVEIKLVVFLLLLCTEY